MRFVILLTTLLTSIISVEILTVRTTQAVQLRDGKVYFVKSPRLLRVATTFDDVNVWGATYYFRIKLPSDAGEALQKITINQHSGLDEIDFDLKDSFAISENSNAKKEKLSLNITKESGTKTVTLKFDPPIEPGQTITVALKPRKNPGVEGIYLFGVTAFPQGESSHGQFLGFGRLHFYRNNN